MNVLTIITTVMSMLPVPIHHKESLPVFAILDIWAMAQTVLVILVVWHVHCTMVPNTGFRYIPSYFVPVSDVDECAKPSDNTTIKNNCHANATCTNTPGGFTCECKTGYAGDGTTCSGNNIWTLCLLC